MRRTTLRDLLAPDPPRWLSRGARVEWRRLAGLAYNLGTLKVITIRSFALLCECLAQEAMARAELERDGITVAAGSGGRKSNPALKIAELARKQAERLLKDFGLSPVSGWHSPLPPDGGQEVIDELEEHLVGPLRDDE